jgi:hypothetical protein
VSAKQELPQVTPTVNLRGLEASRCAGGRCQTGAFFPGMLTRALVLWGWIEWEKVMQRRVVRLLCLLVVGLAAVSSGCSGVGEPGHLRGTASSGPPLGRDSAGVAEGCPVTSPIHDSRPPAAGFTRRARVPWVRMEPNRAAIAVLFYSLDGVSVIGTNGSMGDGRNTKILWVIPNTEGKLTIHGQQIKGDRQFLQKVPGGIQYPSIVKVPVPGCWRLSVSAALQRGNRVVGLEKDSIVLRAFKFDL